MFAWEGGKLVLQNGCIRTNKAPECVLCSWCYFPIELNKSELRFLQSSTVHSKYSSLVHKFRISHIFYVTILATFQFFKDEVIKTFNLHKVQLISSTSEASATELLQEFCCYSLPWSDTASSTWWLSLWHHDFSRLVTWVSFTSSLNTDALGLVTDPDLPILTGSDLTSWKWDSKNQLCYKSDLFTFVF